MTSFLEELKDQYDMEFEVKSAMESKSSYLITVAGLVVPLLFGFGTALIEKISTSYLYFWHINFIVLSGIVLNLISILFSVLSFRVMLYRFAMSHDAFYTDAGKQDTEIINEYLSLNEKEINNKMIEVYLRCNKHNSEMNGTKSELIKMAQWFFLAGVGIIPISLILIYSNLPTFLK